MESLFYLIRRGTFITPLKIYLDKDEISIGRYNFEQLQTTNVVSRHHATIKKTNGRWSIIDLRSTNGSFVNGNKIIACEATPIAIGDRIGIGSPVGASDKYFEFELCQEPQVIVLSDSDDNSNVAVKLETPTTSNLIPYTEHVINNNYFRKAPTNYRDKYADILANQPVVLLHRCDSKFKQYNATKVKRRRKRCRVLYSESSSSSDEECDVRFKKSKIFKENSISKSTNKHYVKQHHSNVHSSSESGDDELNLSTMQQINNGDLVQFNNNKDNKFINKQTLSKFWANKGMAVTTESQTGNQIFRNTLCESMTQDKRNKNVANSDVIENNFLPINMRKYNIEKNMHINSGQNVSRNMSVKCESKADTIVQSDTSFENSKSAQIIPAILVKQEINSSKDVLNPACNKSFNEIDSRRNPKNELTKLFCNERNSSVNAKKFVKQMPYVSSDKSISDKENSSSIQQHGNNLDREMPSTSKESVSKTQQFFKKPDNVTVNRGFSKIFCSASSSGNKNINPHLSHNSSASTCSVAQQRTPPVNVINNKRKENSDITPATIFKGSSIKQSEKTSLRKEVCSPSTHHQLDSLTNVNVKSENMTGINSLEVNNGNNFTTLNLCDESSKYKMLHRKNDCESEQISCKFNSVAATTSKTLQQNKFTTVARDSYENFKTPKQVEYSNQSAVKIEINETDRTTSLKEKEEVLSFNRTVEVKSENLYLEDIEEDNDFCYSQVDEVIVISDDENYLNFSSSQENTSDLLNIKVEPVECDDLNYEYHDDDACKASDLLPEEQQKMEELGSKIAQNFAPNQTKVDNEPKHVEDSIADDTYYSENIDEIIKFINRNTTAQPSPASTSESTSHSNQTQNNVSIAEKNNLLNVDDFFPILSQNFYNTNEVTSEEALTNIEGDEFIEKNDEVEMPALENKNKYFSTILLTEPKPMQYRARKQRGREEWFQDQYDRQEVPPMNLQKKHKGIVKEKQHSDEVVKTKPKQQRKSSSKKSNLKGKVKKEMGYRIPIPNSGSAVRPDQKNKVVKKTTSTSKVDLPKNSARMQSNTKTHSISKCNRNLKNCPKQPSDRFKSRGEFLSNASSENNKNKIRKNSKSAYTIPKKSTVKQNTTSSTEKEINAIHEKTNIGIPSVNNVKSTTSKSLEVSEKADLFKKPQNSSFSRHVSKAKNSTGGCWFRLSDQQPITELSEWSKHRTESIASNFSPITQPNTSNPCMAKQNYPKTLAHNLKINEHSGIEKQRSLTTQLSSDPRLHRDRKQAVLLKENTSVPFKSRIDSNATRNICIVPPNITQPSTSKQISKKPIRLDFDSVLTNILQWNPSWLKEYKTVIKTPPPHIVKNVKCLPLFFTSVDHYIACFFPFILLELWEYIYKEYSEIQQCRNRSGEINAICIMVTECVSKGDIIVLHCESLITSDSAFYPRDGNIIIIEVYEQNNNRVTKLFGYISAANKERFDGRNAHHQWKQRFKNETQSSQNLYLYKFSVKLKKVKFQVALEKLTKAFILCYIANRIRLAEGLQYLNTSLLKNYLLQPFIKPFVKSKNNVLSKSVIGNYNSNQIIAINSITEEIRTSYGTPKILFLQGPPGTGKTHTITGIVQNLFSDKNAKLLITAPSNAAVDEVGRRLTAIRKQTKVEIKIVRVGVYSQIHKEMLPYTLEDHTKKYSEKSIKQELEKLTMELKKKEKLLEDLEKRKTSAIASSSSMGALNEITSRILMENRRKLNLMEEIERVRKKSININDPSLYSDKLFILEKANVILSTLGSCRSRMLEKVFTGKSKTRFTCCIVDEATQCTEPEILQLLAFDVPKLILIGDHKQLPATVYSQLSSKFKYDTSLFERTYQFLVEKKLPSPIFMLTEQYRMHSEICSFPSRQFYSNELYTSLGVNKKYSSFPLKPFIIFNINDSQESNIHCSKKNVLEAEIISEICKQMLPKSEFRNYSVGVITPYQGQKGLVLQKFREKQIPCSVTIDTVDRFQGSERDFIILSCVRARSQNGNIGFIECQKRLNVAITRAKQCLIICGHMTSLERDPIWKALITHSKNLNCYITITALDDIPFLINEIKQNQ